MSHRIKRKPVPGSSIVAGPANCMPHNPDVVDSPMSMGSPEGWSASSTQIDQTGSTQRTSMATDILARKLDVKEEVSREEVQQLGINKKPTPPPKYAAMDASPPTQTLVEGQDAPTPVQSGSMGDDNVSSPPLLPVRIESGAVGSKVKDAYGEFRHFAGGLITHPYESSRHYSIMRHSHGLIYYSGHYTSLALTVFADEELPPARSFWLQRKGFSGSSGLRIGALMGARGGWVNVTPEVQATPDQVKSADERAYQRDITKFGRKATKKIAEHVPKETCILRIPCEAFDGYMRVLMCSSEDGKKTLCSSPLFRLFSTSSESSSVRGASFRTLPLEVGIKVGSTVANNAARAAVIAAAGPYVAAAKSIVGGKVSSVVQPSALQQQAATKAFEKASSAFTDKVVELEDHVDGARDTNNQYFSSVEEDAMTELVVVGDDSGPQKPYPVPFNGRITSGMGKSTAALGVPTANLVNVDSDVGLRYSGVYFGWAAIHVPKKVQEALLIDDDWRNAIIYIAPCADSSAGVVQRKAIKVHILEDFDNAKFNDAKLSVIMMGFLRPVDTSEHAKEEELETQHALYLRDTACTTANLARPNWAADATLARIKSDASARTLTERYVHMRQSTQNSVDKVPMHKLGVRTEGHSMRDRLIGNGGVWIKR